MPAQNASAGAGNAASTKTRMSTTAIVSMVLGGVFLVFLLVCGGAFVLVARQIAEFQSLASEFEIQEGQTLIDARRGFTTQLTKSGEIVGPPDPPPPGSRFELIQYSSPVGQLAAYLTRDPGDSAKHPAIVWITGGDCNSIGDVWSNVDPSNDQSVSAFPRAGIVTMFPSLRGGNANPGRREGFLGEVDDILAATDYLAQQPYVDQKQIYLGGHSTGGTMVMVVAECSDRYAGVFALGPVAVASQYGGDYIYCNPFDHEEVLLRSPLPWLHCVKTPLFVIEGGNQGNWDAIETMKNINKNPQIQFFRISGHDHFSVISPVTSKIAAQILQGQVDLKPDSF